VTGSGADDETDVDISVVLACYAEHRLPSIRAALVSLRKQSLEPATIIVAVDNNARLADLLADEFTWIELVRNDDGRGASATRNRGVSAVQTAFTAFLDDDETADPEWLRTLTRPFADPGVVGTGGHYEPSWHTSKPGWFPDEFAWVVGGSYQGLPTVTAPIRNVWSGNMAVRTKEFRAVGGFRTDFGKRGSIPQPEDTDLCIRMAAASGGHWMYVPDAVIHHDVPADRASLGFFVRRCYAEGAGKAAMQRHLADGTSVSTEHDYVRTVFVEALRRSTGRRPSTRRQGAVMLAGLASAGVGYARGLAASLASASTGSAVA
jgi:GT2 family glycosyltransferase